MILDKPDSLVATGMERLEPRPTISVAMAAFNVAPYVASAVDSVLAQSWADFELIIVDDASTDGTREILRDYAQRDPRIRLIQKDQNEGLSAARNLGIAEARGDWVTFLDADDLYSPDMLRLALEAGRNSNAEMVLWDYVVFSDEGEIQAKVAVPSDLTKIEPANRIALLNRPAFAWTRLVSRDAIARLQISFPLGLTYQDIPVHWRLVTQLDRIALVPHRLAYYRQRAQATTAGTSFKRADFFLVLDQVEAYLEERNLLPVYTDVLTALQLKAWSGVHEVVGAEHKRRVRAMIRERMTDRHNNYVALGRPLPWRVRVFFCAMRGNQLAKLGLVARYTARSFYRAIRRMR